MITLRAPSPAAIRRFLDRQRDRPLSYEMKGMTRGQAPCGYNVDVLRRRLGAGPELFRQAAAAISSWAPYQQHWIPLAPADQKLEPNTVVAISAWVGAFWWSNACRILYTMDKPGPPRRFGFAYGTIVGHAEQGEARFAVELETSGDVWYELLAISRPNHWLARLGYPVTRALQRRFATGSARAIEWAVTGPREPRFASRS